jgi:prevent-host-death family protein
MVKTVSTREARANFGDVLGSVYYTKEPVIVERKGKAVAVIISPEEYERFRQQAAAQGWAAIDRVRERNAAHDPDDVLREVTEEVKAVRRERHERPAR